MSSSSNSDSDEYWEYGTGYNRSKSNPYGRNPFYATMGHPLIYYAQMPQVPQPICMKQRGRERRRDNPNCFVKAFRWYTQEHVPNRSVSSTTKPDMVGFAIWLDTKYDQYLQESQIEADAYGLKVTQTSIIQNNKIFKHEYSNCEPCTAKRFHVKSPWKKRRRAHSNDSKNDRQKSNQSFQYIMQPKDTSRPVSECCQPSTATIVSEVSKKTVVRSRSFSNISLVTGKGPTEMKTPGREEIPIKKSVCGNDACQNVEAKKGNEKVAVPAKIMTVGQDFCCQYNEKKLLVDAETQYDVKDSAMILGSSSTHQSEVSNKCGCQDVDQKTRKPPHKVVIEAPKSPKTYASTDCQCPEQKLVLCDVQTQYEVYEKCPSTPFHDVRCECDFKEFLRNNPPPVQSTSKINQCPCERSINGEIQQKPAVAAQFSQNTAQTSNHSICLDQKTMQEYPLFMKIVCADKLSEDNSK